MHRILWNFEIQTDHLILDRRKDLVIINNNKKRTFCIVDFAILADVRVKIKEGEKRGKLLDLSREPRNQWNRKIMLKPFIIGMLGTVLERVRNQRTNQDYSNYSIVENGQNIEKSPRYPRRRAGTQTLMKDHLLMLV